MDWQAINARRFLLIHKEFENGLTAEEREELDQLQTAIAQRLEALHPLPFDRLEELERAACELAGGATTARAPESERS